MISQMGVASGGGSRMLRYVRQYKNHYLKDGSDSPNDVGTFRLAKILGSNNLRGMDPLASLYRIRTQP
jgi:hypothetical protein